MRKSLVTSLGSLHLCFCEGLSVHVGRYFGSAEGSKFVEMASVDNVKRTWVNYGGAREWSDPTQGQVGGGESVVVLMQSVLLAIYHSYSYILTVDGILNDLWHLLPLLLTTSQGEEFLYHATEVKNIWLPMGEIFAN